MEMFPVEDFLREDNSKQIIYNRGIGGFVTDDMLQNMNEQIFDLQPSAIFINIGIIKIFRSQTRKCASLQKSWDTAT